MSDEVDTTCRICGEASASVQQQWETRDCYYVECPVCARYFLDGPVALTVLPSLPDKHLLSAATRWHWEESSKPLELFTEGALTEATTRFVEMDTPERAQTLLKYLVSRSGHLGQAVGVRHETDYPLGVCHDGQEFIALLRYLHGQGYVHWPTTPVNGVWPYVVTVEGWDRVRNQKPRMGFHP